ncbi:eEF1A lysine and N-terminal methyltransferase homolog [Planococcus citri]|uniref:eEF1A lysine and N-terminal methyltransferase homolog n=1 Tax=Planococcus citri TaxID=170843 RepID=UPI0031F807CA
MFMLPKTSKEYSNTDYWDKFFTKRGKSDFEWYGEYEELCNILHKYMKPVDDILVIGCGNSAVSSNLYDLSYKKITNIDISNVVIKRMQQKYAESRPGLVYLQMDALQTNFNAASFSVIFDKGTLDALYNENTAEAKDRATKLFVEVERLLKFGGRYVCISLLQDFILDFVLDYFTEKGWLIRICKCADVEKNQSEFSLPVFAVVCTKMKKLPNFEPFLEFTMDDTNVIRTDKDELKSNISSIQQAEIVCNGLNRNCLNGSNNEALIEVVRPGETLTRYTIIIIDPETAHRVDNMKFAAFVVPTGKNDEWMFSNPEGRQVLRQNCPADRVALIFMHEGHEYPDLKGIQNELSDTIIKLAPRGVRIKNEKVMFLTMSVSKNENKEVRFRGKSKFSGEYIVDDVVDNGEHYRRLIFLNRGTVIQSEVKLKKSEDKNEEEIDQSYISCEYHISLNIGVCLAVQQGGKSNYDVLILGLGGGVLSNLIHRCFDEVVISAVEIDEEIHKVAQDHFGLRNDDRIKIHITDGLEHLSQCAEKGVKFDAIIFDVDNKDPSVGLSCPPVSFLQMDVLKRTAECLSDKGLFLLNFVCRSKAIKKDVFKKIKTLFAGIVSLKNTEDVNEVVICWKEGLKITKTDIDAAAQEFFKRSKTQDLAVNDDILNITKTMESIKL